MLKIWDMLFLLRIGIIVGCLYVVACTSPQTNPETRVVAETAPQSDKGQTVSSDTSASDSIYTLEYVYELAGKTGLLSMLFSIRLTDVKRLKNIKGISLHTKFRLIGMVQHSTFIADKSQHKQMLLGVIDQLLG